MLALIMTLLAAVSASGQMSESPVGAGFKDTAIRTRYIPPPPQMSMPEVKPAAKAIVKPTRGPASVATAPVVTRPAVVQKPVMRTVAPTRAPANTSYRVAANTMATETYVPSIRTSERKKERRSGAQSPSRWTFSGFYNLAKETAYSGNTAVQGQSQSFSANESSAPGFGIAGSYGYRPASGFGFNAQLAFEYNRTATKMSGEAGGQALNSDYGSGYTTNTFTGALNGSYSLGSVYFYGGANFPYIMGSSAVQLTGLPGYQAGAGYSFTRNWSVHTEYRLIRMKGTLEAPPSRLEVSEASMGGFILSFDFSI